MKKILMSHYCDLDGIAPIILSKYYNMHIDAYVPIAYGSEKDSDNNYLLDAYKEEDNDILIVDFAISKELFLFVKENFKSYKIFDHHDNSLLLPADDENIHVDLSKSGTLLFYQYLIDELKLPKNDIINQFVNIVNTYDTWQKDSPLWNEAENLNRVLWRCVDYHKDEGWDKFNLFIKLQLDKLLYHNEWYWTDYEKNLIQDGIAKEYQELKNAEGNMKIRTDSNGNKFILYHGSSKISQTCNSLLEKHNDIVYIININTFQGRNKKSINGKVSVRSKDDFDVNTLHNIHGHKNAGGGEFAEKFLVDLWVGKVNNIPYIKSRSSIELI